MGDITSKLQELLSWAWSYPVPLMWIGWGLVAFVGLFAAVGLVIGFKMKWEGRKNAECNI